MKSLILMLALSAVSFSAFSGTFQKIDYSCVIPKLEAFNEDYYGGITPEEVDRELVKDSGLRWKVIEATQECEREAHPRTKLNYACMSERLEMYNGGAYADVSRAKMEELIAQGGVFAKMAYDCSSN